MLTHALCALRPTRGLEHTQCKGAVLVSNFHNSLGGPGQLKSAEVESTTVQASIPQSNAPSVLSRNYAAVNSAHKSARTLLAAGGLEGVSGSRHVFSSRSSATSKVCPRSPKWES